MPAQKTHDGPAIGGMAMGTRDAFVGTSFGSVVGLSDCFRGGEAKITNSEILQFVLKKDLVLSAEDY